MGRELSADEPHHLEPEGRRRSAFFDDRNLAAAARAIIATRSPIEISTPGTGVEMSVPRPAARGASATAMNARTVSSTR